MLQPFSHLHFTRSDTQQPNPSDRMLKKHNQLLELDVSGAEHPSGSGDEEFQSELIKPRKISFSPISTEDDILDIGERAESLIGRVSEHWTVSDTVRDEILKTKIALPKLELPISDFSFAGSEPFRQPQLPSLGKRRPLFNSNPSPSILATPKGPSFPCLGISPKTKRQMTRVPLPEHLFKAPPLPIMTDIPSIDGAFETNGFNPTRGYHEGSKIYHNVIKQENAKSCGATALLMLYTDLARKNLVNFELKDDFWLWYAQCSLTNATELQKAASAHTNLQRKSLKISSTRLPTNHVESLKKIKDLLIQTELPLILSITHKQIGGHWIVVDKFQNGHFLIRDPLAGCAYYISEEELRQNFDTGTSSETCIYVERASRERVPSSVERE